MTFEPPHMVQHAVVNMRGGKQYPVLELDGVAFPYLIFCRTSTNGHTCPIVVEATDDNVHLLTLTIMVDRSVRVIDRTMPEERD